MAEVEKYENSKRLLDIENNKKNKKKAAMLQTHQTKVRQLDEEYNDLLQEQRTLRERVQKEIDHLQREYGEIITQIKYETDEEIQGLKKKNTEDTNNIQEQGRLF